MNIFKTAKEMRIWSDTMQRGGESVSLVPTMGYFHDGHLSLMDLGKKEASTLAVSLFVNPTQFGENEDLDAYPMDIDRDLALAEARGVDAVFLPERDEIYPQGYQTAISLKQLPHHLCGLSRPVHFGGGCNGGHQTLYIVRPQVAIFGSKDFQPAPDYPPAEP